MPELPEVEIISMQLDSVLKGLRITGVEVLNKKSFIGPTSLSASLGTGPPSPCCDGATLGVKEIIGKKVIAVRRRGKITIIQLEKNLFLAIHLKLTGQLIYREEVQRYKGAKVQCEQKDGPFAVCELPNKFTRVIISFCKGEKACLPAGRVFFNDLRMFGWIKIIQNSKLKDQNYNSKLKILDEELGIGKFGPEANDENSFTLDYFKDILSKTSKPIKIVIMDQENLAGVGNIYANEALFTAGILPTRKANSLTEEDIKILRDSILRVLKEAIKHRGSSDKDEAYRQITGEKGTHQNYLQIYGRAGQKCPSCGGLIKRIAIGGRGTFYCSSCQK